MPRNSLFSLLFTAAALSAATADAAVPACGGVVYADLDGDGRRGDAEPGIAGVGLFDGVRLHRTDAGGRFVLSPGVAPDGHRVHVVKPAGFRLPRGAAGLPAIGLAACGDVALQADPRPAGALDVLLFSDPQPKDARQVAFYGRGIVDAVRAAHPGDAPPAHLGLTLGDIVDDDVSLFPAMNALTLSLGVPWLHVPGNHDVDAAEPRDAASLASFHATYGPDTYAWEEHEASFIVLDDVIWRPGGDVSYIGGLREEQFAYLAAYLRDLPSNRPLVIAAHIPFSDDEPGVPSFRRADRERLFALLRRFGHVLLLTGHAHAQRHHWHDADDGWHGASPLHEYVVGAACGSYWGGVDDAAGLPTSTMADGTPKGWGELGIGKHGRHALRWQVAEAGIAPDTAIALHAPKVLRRGSYPGFAVYANVFMGFEGMRVEYRVDDGDWRAMRQSGRPDPRVVEQNVRDDIADGLRAFDRLPEAAPSTHLWRGALPTGLAPGAHRVQVRAYDPWRGEITAETTYRLEEADASGAAVGSANG